jgi:acyl carrier protein
MTRAEISAQVTSIFKDVLDNDDITLTDLSAARDIEEWDSLTNIQLVVAIEKHFRIRFTTPEITGWKNVGEMLDSIAAKKAQ